MKKKLLIQTLNWFQCYSPKSSGLLVTLLLVLNFALIEKTSAQCIGPYARFESVKSKANMQADGWSFSTTANVGTTLGIARSGTTYALLGNVNFYIQTPLIANPDNFSFYYRNNSTVNTITFKVEWSTDIAFGSILGTSGNLTVSSLTYSNYSVSLSGLSNIYVRVTYVSNTAGSALYLDDFSWTSTVASENRTIVPVQQGNGAPTNCAGGSVTLNSSDVYTMYDNGGEFDGYNLNQNNQVTFSPSGAAFTAGDRVRVQFVNYTSVGFAATTDRIDVWDNNGTTLDATTNILGHTSANGLVPSVLTYISTIATDGSLTVRFASDAVTNNLGFKILVDLVRCAVPTGLAASSVGSTTASLTWGATSANNYDVYYSTSNTPPSANPVNNPPTFNVINVPGANTVNLTGLTTSATYYVWVRSRCSSSPDSYSPWSSPISFSTVDCSAFSITTNPSNTAQNPCLSAGSTALTVAATGGAGYGYQWYSNVVNSNSGGTLLGGATLDTYSPLTTATGTLYYYCVVTSTTPGCSATSTVSGAVTVIAAPSVAPVATAGTLVTSNSFSANWGAVAGATGYRLDVSTNIAFGSYVGIYNNLALGNVVTLSVAGLNAGTTYYYRVRAFNTCGTTTSSNIITVTTTALSYCIPSGNGFFQDPLGITNFSAGTINNTTVIEANNYGDYTSLSTNVFVGATLPFSVTLRTGYGYSTNVWVDWNNDGDFIDAGELVYQGESGATIPTTLSGSFPVPLLNSNALSTVGSHRMRVGAIDFGPFTDPCRNGNYQAFEDYTLNVIAVPPCAVSTPSALTTVNVSATSASLVWSDAAMTPNTIYNYWVSTTNTPPALGSDPIGMGTVTGALTANVTGLTLGVTYYFWVRVKCDAVSYSAWIGSANFTTVNLDIVNMTTGSLTTCNAKFYDSAGFASQYNNNESFTYTFTPASGTNLKVLFNSFSTEPGYDFLSIYDGPTTASPLLGTFSGTQIAAGQAFYSSAANGGSLTFRFTSDISETSTGWDANITCVSVPSITSFTPTFACAGSTPLVTITGTNFTGATSVTFNGVVAAHTVVNATTITATLPVSATTGVISVITPDALGNSVTSFQVRPLPSTPVASADVVICSGLSTNLSVASAPVNGSLATTVIGGNGCTGGNMFDIVTGSSPITINAFDIVPENTALQNVSVYYKVGTYVGSETTAGAWTLLGTYPVNGVSRVLINMPTGNINIPASSTYGIYINYNASYTSLATTYSNADISIVTGAGLCGSFSLVNAGRTFNGAVYYQLNATLTYAWSPATGLSATNIANPVASPTSDQTYTVTTTLNGCTSASDSVVVTVNPKPTVSIPTAGGNICANSVILVSSAGTASTYTWTSTVANTLFTDATGTTPYVAGSNAAAIYVKTPTTATITLTGTNTPSGCFDTATVIFTVSTKTYNVGFWTPGGPPLNNGTENLVFNSGTYTSTGDLSACSCSVTGATVTIANGHTVSLVNGLTVSGGSMTFDSGASLLQTNPVTNTGNIIYKRDSTPCFRYDYTYWSSPVASQTLIGLSPGTSASGFFDYNPTISFWQESNSALPMTIGKGYLVRVPSTFPVSPSLPINFTANFTGVPNNGTIPLSVVYNAPDGLNLIGNPYPSALNAANLVTDPGFNVNGNFLGGTIYLWSHNTNLNMVTGQYEYNDYAVWNILGGINTYASSSIGSGNMNAPTGNIAAGQGFFIKTIATGTAYFRNTMRTGGATNSNTNFYRNATNLNTANTDPTATYEKHRIWLDISNEGNAYKQMLVGYIQDGTDGLDRLFDGEMVDNENRIVLYTKVEDKKLSIQGRGLTFTTDDIFALGYKATVADNYTINLSDYDGLFTGQAIYLEDTLLNVIHNLKESSYSFASDAGTFEERFVLRFTTETLDVPTFNDESIVVYRNNRGVHISTGRVPMESVAIYDVTGRLVVSKNAINSTETSFTTLPQTQQVLLVKVTSQSGATITKKVLY
ncbi:T9SS sorting signal type C domain-containing protein [Flavobacterium sp. 102]|uniref:T9SS sorting signal type C domain-containing protein n=1 Tax=Flavobacterium sp. 102 TaxID=2135623 RepID=UPI000EACB777|nr:T9SS sorting signal type C domain-containing protein [Flavobacterium sp. 102]RKS01850.1 fibronectin type III domain protein [Flavobacterium sp. 102]